MSLDPTPVPAPQPAAEDRAPFSLLNSPPLRALGVFLLVGGAFAMLHLASPVLNPMILGVFIVTLALPTYRALRQRGVAKLPALLLLMTVTAGLGLGIAALLWLSLQRLIEGLGPNTERIREAAGVLAAQVGVGGGGAAGVGAGAARFFVTLVSAVASAITQFVISTVLAVFLLLEAPRFGRLLHTSMKDLPFLGIMPQVMDAAVRYFLIRLRLNLLTGALFGLFLWLVGVDYPLLWAALAFLLSFVPYIGLVIAGAPAVLLALAESGWVWALVVAVVLTLLNFAVENAVAPSMTGRSLSLSPAVVLVAFLFWIWLLGAIGALIAMPMTVLLMLTFRAYPSTRWVAEVIGGQEEGARPA